MAPNTYDEGEDDRQLWGWLTRGGTSNAWDSPPIVSATIGTSSNTVDLTKIGGTSVDANSGSKSAGTLRVVVATDQPALTNALLTTLKPATSGGLSIYRNLDVGTTGVRIKSGAGQVYGWFISNNASTARFVKLYDSNSNPPTSAETPVLTLQIPASSAANVPHPTGLAFASGIGIRASTGVADNDTGATTTNDVIVNLYYA